MSTNINNSNILSAKSLKPYPGMQTNFSQPGENTNNKLEKNTSIPKEKKIYSKSSSNITKDDSILFETIYVN